MTLLHNFKYFFTNTTTYFTEFYLSGFQNYSAQYNMTSWLQYGINKTNLKFYNFFLHYTYFIYTFLLSLEIRLLQQSVYYLTTFNARSLHFSGLKLGYFYSNNRGTFEGVTNSLMMHKLMNYCSSEHRLFEKTGLILNFSAAYHNFSVLRFLRQTENIVASVDFHYYSDYSLFNNANTHFNSELRLVKFFNTYSNYVLTIDKFKQIMSRVLFKKYLKKNKTIRFKIYK